jgi:hypothetical protein
MYNNLVQIAKAKGIYRTLALCAILSPKPVGKETTKCSPKIHGRQTNKRVSVGDIGAGDKCLASAR